MPSLLKATDPRAFLSATPAQIALINFAGCDDHGEGLTSVVQYILEALDLLHAHTQLPNSLAWKRECRHLLQKCEEAEEGEHFHLGSEADSPSTSKVFKSLARPVESPLPQAANEWSLQVLGWLIASAAAAGTTLHFDVLDAWMTLRRGRASNDPAWREVPISAPTDQKAVEEILRRDLPTRLRTLLEAFYAALQSTLDLPANESADPDAIQQPHGDSKQSVSHTSIDDEEDDVTQLRVGPTDRGEPGVEEQVGSSSTKWLAGQANFAPYVARFGLIGARDRLHPKELRQVVHSLKADFLSGADDRKDKVAFAHISLKSATPARIALDISTVPGTYPRLDIPAGEFEWCVRHAQQPVATDDEESEAPRSGIEIIRIALDEDIAQHLRELLLERPKSTNVRELLGVRADLEARRKWLREYRAYLRSHGDSLHAAYDARFARSEGDTYREIGAPDIVAALMAQDFQGCPMSLLHYATFPREYLRKFNRSVNDYLGLRTKDEPAPVGVAGASIWISPEEFKRAWIRLQDQAAQALKDLRKAKSADALIDAFNRLATARLTTFITVTGHRATKLSRLTMRALFAHEKYLSIFDKDVGDYLSQRVIPAHTLADSLLGCLARDVELLERHAAKLGLSITKQGRRAISAPEQDAVAFFHIKADPAHHSSLQRSPIRSGEVTRCAMETFGRAANIGRHFLVSQLFIQGSSAWIVRVLTGHARTHAECFSDGMAIPPSHALAELESALNRLFRSLELAPIPGARRSGARALVQIGGALPSVSNDAYLHPKMGNHFRVLPAPFDAHTLTAVRVTEVARRLVTGAGLTLEPGARLVAHFLLVDLLDPADQAMLLQDLENSLALLGSAPWAFWKRQGCANEIGQPLASPTIVALRLVEVANPGDWKRHAGQLGRWARRTFADLEWPQNDLDAFYALACLALRWRRFVCSPSLLTAQSRAVPSATYTRRSLRRLNPASAQHPDSLDIGTVVRNGSSRRRTTRDGALGDLVDKLAEAGKTTIRSGEERARARALIQSLKKINTSGDEHARAFKTVLLQEALNWIQLSSDKDQFSTLAGYSDEVLIALSCIPRHDHPANLEPVEYEDWVELAKEAIDSEKSETAEVARDQTRYFGLKRFLRMGRKAGWQVPDHLFSDDGPRVVFDGMRRSAASALLLKADFAAMRSLISKRFADWPFLEKRAILANKLLEHAPLRSMEQIVLRKKCVVSAIDALSIGADGFSHLKSLHAFRLIDLPADVIDLLTEGETSEDESSSRYLFLDDECVDWRMAREIDEAQVAAACCVSGDARMRKHSFRASATCRMAWPEWEDVGLAACTGRRTPGEHDAFWRRDFFRGFPSLIRAVRATGHGHHLTTLVYYCPAWPLLLASQLAATLTGIPATNEFIEECFQTTDSTRRAKSRAVADGIKFDAWNHLADRAAKLLKLRPLQLDEAAAVVAPTAATCPTPSFRQIASFSAHTLIGAPTNACAEEHQIPSHLVRKILAAMPEAADARDIVRRLHGDPAPSVLARDRRFLRNKDGMQMTTAMLAAPLVRIAALLHDLSPSKRNLRPVPTMGAEFVARIESHLACLPDWAGAQIRFSECHPLPVSPELLQHLRPRIWIGPSNDRIGAQPMFQIFKAEEPENLTVMGRLTALTRVLAESALVSQKVIEGVQA